REPGAFVGFASAEVATCATLDFFGTSFALCCCSLETKKCAGERMSAQPPDRRPHHEPRPHEDYTVEKDAVSARQGVELGAVRWVLLISLVLVVLGLILAWLFVF